MPRYTDEQKQELAPIVKSCLRPYQGIQLTDIEGRLRQEFLSHLAHMHYWVLAKREAGCLNSGNQWEIANNRYVHGWTILELADTYRCSQRDIAITLRRVVDSLIELIPEKTAQELLNVKNTDRARAEKLPS